MTAGNRSTRWLGNKFAALAVGLCWGETPAVQHIFAYTWIVKLDMINVLKVKQSMSFFVTFYKSPALVLVKSLTPFYRSQLWTSASSPVVTRATHSATLTTLHRISTRCAQEEKDSGNVAAFFPTDTTPPVLCQENLYLAVSSLVCSVVFSPDQK